MIRDFHFRFSFNNSVRISRDSWEYIMAKYRGKREHMLEFFISN